MPHVNSDAFYNDKASVSEPPGCIPLPEGWDIGRDFDGKIYFIDHNSKKTTWTDPRCSSNRQSSSSSSSSSFQQNNDCNESYHYYQPSYDYQSQVSLLQNHPQPFLQQEAQQHAAAQSYVIHPDQQQQQQQHRHIKPTNLNLNNIDNSSLRHFSNNNMSTVLGPAGPSGFYPTEVNANQNNIREDLRLRQEEMLRQYLSSAESDLRAKQELADIKQQRLSLAQDEFNHLNNTLAALSASTTSSASTSPNVPMRSSSLASTSGHPSPTSLHSKSSSSSSSLLSTSPYHVQNFNNSCAFSYNNNSNLLCVCGGGFSTSQSSLNSTGSTASTKYDPDLLKYDVQHAKARVQRLRRELTNIGTEMAYKQKGVETLAQVKAKFADEQAYSVSQAEANAIRVELNNIQKSLSTGEQEKVELIKSLACIKDDLTRLQHSESSLDVSTSLEKFSTASQTDLSGEMVPVGARLAEMAKLRLRYDEARRHVQDIQQGLSSMDEKMNPGQLESDKDRLLLIQDKEQLLRELRSISPRSRSKSEMTEIHAKIQKLEKDLNNAMEVSNRCIADRLKLHEEKQHLLQQLKDGMRAMSKLESQLKLLSASTLSMSSSSSLGSLSSSHASSKGSLSSLSFTDIYGLSTTVPTDPAMLDLHRRVDKILNNSSNHQQIESGLQSAEESLSPESETCNDHLAQPATSQPGLSPRSSLSSVSPPVSPQDGSGVQQPPSYDQTFLSATERQKKLLIQQQLNEARQLTEQIAELGLNKNRNVSKLSTISETFSNAIKGKQVVDNPQYGGDLSVVTSPLSPISEVAAVPSPNKCPNKGSPSEPSRSSAISDESVAGDSGVFEAVTRPHPTSSKSGVGSDPQLGGLPSMNLETAQVQIKLRYALEDSLLHVGIERARNVSALFIPENKKICIKSSLLPSISTNNWSFCTRAITNLEKATFGESFPVSVPKNRLGSKTLQVTIWSIDDSSKEDCLGSAQVSLADFDIETVSIKWYNVLSFHFMQQPEGAPKPIGRPPKSRSAHAKQMSDVSSAVSSKQGTLKEESSDESTIISSQTSTLTRNFGPEAILALGKVMGDHNEGEIAESEEEDDEAELVIPSVSDLINSFNNAIVNQDSADKETNTECIFLQPNAAKRTGSSQEDGEVSSALVKRSQTFSPSAKLNKTDYICKINRSDSDSAMSIHKRLAFQRTMLERRSLRVPPTSFMHSINPNSSSVLSDASKVKKNRTAKIQSVQTPIDLELDLAAQQTKLKLLRDEIDRLKEIKVRLEEAKTKGSKELPSWLQENEKFQHMLEKLQNETQQMQSSEERRIEKMLKKTGKDIYKLRKTKTASKGQLDVQAFKEKMAFFTSLHSEIPVITDEEATLDENVIPEEQIEAESKNSTLKHSVALTDPLSVLPKSIIDQEGSSNSCETVNTLTEEQELEEEKEKFTYEVDPDIGVIV